jgi:ATPase subunit of ABC transporter with duplicated ATPase domains
MQEKEKLLARPNLTDKEGERLGELECTVAEEDGYTAEPDAAQLLSGLGIAEEEHGKLMKEVAGGYKLRVLLAQALFGKPEALLLDEPTNNLDIDGIRWLEKFLSSYEGVLVTISHDRHFLNEICTQIADIDYETIIVYPGGYDDMVVAKSQVRGKIEQENAERKKKIEQLSDFVARFAAGTRASQVQSRKKQIEKLALSDLKKSNIERPFIQFLVKKPSGKQTLTLEGVTKRWPGVTVCEGFSALVTKGEKVGIVGRSGVGKTTLCRMLMSEIDPDAGKIIWGHEAKPGYLAQDHREGIANGTNVSDWLYSFDGTANQQDIRGLLGKMLFKGEKADRRALRGRSGAPHLREVDADQGQRAHPRRADQPLGPRVDRGAGRRLDEIRRDGIRRHARSRSHRVVRDAALRLHRQGPGRFQGHLRGVHRQRRCAGEAALMDDGPMPRALLA